MCPHRNDGLFCGRESAKTSGKNQDAPSGKPKRLIPINLI